jgi:hypothetical protein
VGLSSSLVEDRNCSLMVASLFGDLFLACCVRRWIGIEAGRVLWCTGGG